MKLSDRKTMRNQRRGMGRFGTVLLTLLLAACSLPPRAPQRFQKEFYGLFDTVVIFTAYAENQTQFDEYAEVLYGRLLDLHNQFDIYHENQKDGIANLKAVNDNAGKSPVKVGADVMGLLRFAKEAYTQTAGAVNVAMGPVLRIWHDWRAEATQTGVSAPPSPEALEAAAVHTDIEKVLLDEEAQTVFLAEEGMALDVGALAKGYAVQLAAESLRDCGVTAALVSAGGNICAIGAPGEANRSAWHIGVQNPDIGAAEDVIDTLQIKDLSAVTSGYKQRFVTLDGAIYGHIIDSETLEPAQRYKAVTILHPDSAMADMLSTALYILPETEGKALVERAGGEALWCLHDGEYRFTEGYGARSEELAGGRN